MFTLTFANGTVADFDADTTLDTIAVYVDRCGRITDMRRKVTPRKPRAFDVSQCVFS